MTVQMQIRLPPSVAARFQGLSPRLRGQAIAAVLTGAIDGVDVRTLLTSLEELRRVGVNLNQLLHISHTQGSIPPEMVARVNELLAFFERIRGRA